MIRHLFQSYSQTGEETPAEETQTDSIVLKNKWTQHPPNHSTSGGQLLKLSQVSLVFFVFFLNNFFPLYKRPKIEIEFIFKDRF